jgi:lipid-binding SYLF domain-containing protein
MSTDAIKIIQTLLIGFVLVISSCSSLTSTEQDQKRSELDAMAAVAITRLIEQDPSLKAKIDAAPGYGVGNMKLTKVPIVGGGGGEGVMIEKNTQNRYYFNITRADLGGGVGARGFKILFIFKTQEIVDAWKTGTWKSMAGAEASAGTASAEGAAGGDGFSMHILSEAGASATATARVMRVKLNKELTNN